MLISKLVLKEGLSEFFNSENTWLNQASKGPQHTARSDNRKKRKECSLVLQKQR